MTSPPGQTPNRVVRVPDDLMSRARLADPGLADVPESILIRAALAFLADAGRSIAAALAEAGQTTRRQALGGGRPRSTIRKTTTR